MPSYDYECRTCGERFSRRESIADHEASRAACPKCESTEVDRVLSGFYARTPRKS